MANVIELIPEAVEAAILLFPELVDIPIAGRILIAIAGKHPGEPNPVEELQKVADKKKTDRKTRIEHNARYVIKASEAMKCVEENLMNGQVLTSFLKGLVNAILGRTSGGSAPDILVEKIFTCIEEHVLRQDTPRVIGDHSSKYVRPRKGHGHGRGKI